MFNNLKILLVALLGVSTVCGDTQFATGEKIYKETCVSCHGADGETNQDIKLVVKPRVLRKSILSEEQMFYLIKEGAHAFGAHADIMPTFKYIYTDEEIKAVAHYVAKKFNPKRAKRIQKLMDEVDTQGKTPSLKIGEKIFKKKCSLCHGKTGNGESLYVEQSKDEIDFIYPYNLQKILLTEKQIFLYAKYGGKFWGTDKNDMPAWKRKYNDFKLLSVAKYIEEKIKKRAH